MKKNPSTSIYHCHTSVPSLVIDGKLLKDKDVPRLERCLDENELDGKVRLKLVGYYTRKMQEQGSCGDELVQHISWIIEHFPDSPFFEIYRWRKNDSDFQTFKKVWEKSLKNSCNNSRVFANASKFYSLADVKASTRLLKKAIEIDPNDSEWLCQVSQNYYLRSRSLFDKDELRYVKKSLKAGQQALELHSRFPKYSYVESHFEMIVSELSERALDFGFASEANYFGRYLLERNKLLVASPVKRNLTYSKHGYEVHIAYSILGRAALLKDDIELAKKFLTMMPPFGQPDWRHDLLLAKELLEKGEDQAVKDYLKACANNLSDRIWELSKIPADESRVPAWLTMVWESHAPELSLTEFMQLSLKEGIKEIDWWVAEIGKGEKLKLPDFIQYDC